MRFSFGLIVCYTIKIVITLSRGLLVKNKEKYYIYVFFLNEKKGLSKDNYIPQLWNCLTIFFEILKPISDD